MKNIFKKIAVIALVMIMCVGSIVPSISAAETTCPGKDVAHTADNCSYTVAVKTDATCLTAGIVTGQCNSCGTKFVAETVEALGHDWDLSAATCTTPITKTCKVCGEVETNPLEVGHKFSEWTVTGGVCKVGERRSRTCEVCKYTESGIMEEAHAWVVDSCVEPENCEKPAIAYYVCENSGCGATKTAKLYLRGEDATHNDTFEDWDVAQAALVAADPTYVAQKDPNYVAPTCASVGYRSEVCPDCDYVRVVTIDKEPHITQGMIDKGLVGPEARANLKKVDEVFENGCLSNGIKAFWQCFDCGVRYLAVEESGDPTPMYAKNGTKYPAYVKDDLAAAGLTIADCYVLYYDHNYKEDEIGALIEKDSQLTINDIGDHARYTVYVPATCDTDGYYSLRCSRCGLDESKVLPALGHVYYTDVAAADQAKYIKAVGLKDTTKWANIAPGKADGKGYTWIDGADATCEKNAYVYQICLNSFITQANEKDGTWKASDPVRCYDKNDTDMTPEKQPELFKEYILKGEGKEATGHEWDKKDGAIYTGKPDPTCTATGVYEIKCADCDATKIETAPAKGHNFADGTVVTGENTYAATCLKDGSKEVKCKDCDVTQISVVVKTDADHAWKYIPTEENKAAGYTDSDLVAAAIAALNCNQTLTVVRYCNVAECPANANPASYTAKGNDHKYYNTDNASNYKKIVENLAAKGDKLDANGDIITTDGILAVVEYMVPGTCVNVASYRLYCTKGCGMFKSFEIAEGFNSGAHDIVFAGVPKSSEQFYSDVAADCGQTVQYKYGYWYCATKTCDLYSKTSGDRTEGVYKTYSAHLNDEGKAITYKDVPDAAISGAATLDEARKVKAPVDANGNVTYAIEIPGTSLVWLYVADVSCSNDGVSLGGFYCVDCKNTKDLETKAQFYMMRNDYHNKGTVTKTGRDAIGATCTSYGYSEKTCKYCFTTVQYDFKEALDHAYSVETEVKATCYKEGYKVEKCDNCDDIKSTITPIEKHVNRNGDELAFEGSCLVTVTDRKCVRCNVTIFNHFYGADNKCTLCGITKPAEN